MNLTYGTIRPLGGNTAMDNMRENQRRAEEMRRMEMERQRRMMVRDPHRPHMG